MAATLMQQRDNDKDARSDFPGPTSTIKGLTGTRFGNREVLRKSLTLLFLWMVLVMVLVVADAIVVIFSFFFV